MSERDTGQPMTVAQLITALQSSVFYPDEIVRVGITDGTRWAELSTPVMRLVDHVGAYNEGAFPCLEIRPDSWGINGPVDWGDES